MSGIINNLLESIEIPKMVKVKQRFKADKIDDVSAEVQKKLKASQLLNRIKPGQTVAITGGSRGISDLPLVIKELVQVVKSVGGEPFIIPAMGSHGGATAAGQEEVLSGMGITPTSVGAPIKATMDVVQIAETESGLPVFIDKYASQADAIIIVNRIKSHVAFRGRYESGLMKMMTIGLGKQKGAETCHNLGFGKMAENIPAIATKIIEKTNLIFGIGILENAYDQTSKIVVIPAEEIPAKEPVLLKEAKKSSAFLHFKKFEVLIMDEIGKDISGTGLDTNVVGRFHTPFADDGSGPEINKMGVLNLTDKSHGNANGIGIVDYTTRRLFDKMDLAQTYANSLTSTVAVSIKIPMILENDKQVFQAAIKCCNLADKTKARIVRIKNTKKLENIYISETLLDEARNNPQVEILSEPFFLPFDQKGNLF